MVKDYAQSFKDVLVYEKSNPKDPNVLKDFTKTIDKIRDRHTNTGEKIVKLPLFYYKKIFFVKMFLFHLKISVITMAEAVMAMKHSATSVQKSGKNGNGNKQPRYMQNIQVLKKIYVKLN